ncbi:NAD(P)-dependent dehydrogenase (short-subunit alcohol dehydrogenase family) [Williamsia limnetica]|uniref:NAD(P)-dependent dehydrogenase (Short-subunit alcohol dehydrogenase family) n=1 Tax=Williamsia limnetica TaxID=882452 RepID=A0A318RVP2_WILLI|nr:SDR family oxidoreductase [Williamsia limnetica]PYE17041.1 NAD(P)-dependent dehydrogenase (short-subunit alcohol dehydrogenase family) [Williamsia limnetica]
MDLQVRDKRFVLIGGTAGMGLATAKVLAEDGASLVLVGRDDSRARSAARTAEEAGATKAFGIAHDASVAGGAQAAIDAAVDLLGGIDGLSVTMGTEGMVPVESTDDVWTSAFRDVLLATTRSVEAALPYLTQSRGTVVTTAAYSIRSPEIARLPYASLKAGVAVFTKGIAKTYGKHGIRANCVCPGAVETGPMAALRIQLAEQRGYPLETALERVMFEEWGFDAALGRPGKPEEVGELIAFLLSPRAGFLTGSLINIDGGTNF